MKIAKQRMYVDRSFERVPSLRLPHEFVPGDTLCNIITEFYESGVAPDFIQAELGEDGDGDFTEDGDLIIDPRGDIRTDPFEFRDRALVEGFAEDVVPKRFGAESPSNGADGSPDAGKVVESHENASSGSDPE